MSIPRETTIFQGEILLLIPMETYTTCDCQVGTGSPCASSGPTLGMIRDNTYKLYELLIRFNTNAQEYWNTVSRIFKTERTLCAHSRLFLMPTMEQFDLGLH